jgi:hypothetical protein
MKTSHSVLIERFVPSKGFQMLAQARHDCRTKIGRSRHTAAQPPSIVYISNGESAFDEKKGEDHFFSLIIFLERDFERVPFAFRFPFHLDLAELIISALVQIVFNPKANLPGCRFLKWIARVQDVFPFPLLVRASVNEVRGGLTLFVATAEIEQLRQPSLNRIGLFRALRL